MWTTAELIEAEGAVLRKLRENGAKWTPSDLIAQLIEEGVPEDRIRAAIWYLIDRTDIILTLDWKLVLPERNAAAA